METKAIVRGVRLSVDKGRLVADLIRGKKVDQALNILEFTPKKAAGAVKKALESAIAKAHPTGFRLAVTRNWASRWYATNRNFASMLAEDLEVREFLKKKLKNAAVSRILIERPAKSARITIFSARPGVVIGKKGEDIENLKLELAKRLNVPVSVNIEEVRKPEVDAQLIADSITQQLEKRIMFRRAMKRAIQNAIEIARTEWYREGRVPLHTLRADIDYGFSEAHTTYGVIGVKVWVYRGDRLANGEAPVLKGDDSLDDRRNRRGPRGDRPNDRRGPGAGRGGPGRGAPRADGAPAEGSDKPAVAAGPADAKRVRKAAPAAEAKGE